MIYLNAESKKRITASGSVAADSLNIYYQEEPNWTIQINNISSTGVVTAADVSDAVAWQFSIDKDHSQTTTPMCRTLNADIIKTDTNIGKLIIPVDATRAEFLTALGTAASVSGWFELKGFNSAGKRIYYFKQAVTCGNIIDADGTTPLPVPDNLITEAQLAAYVAGAWQVEFSVDGSTLWHSTQVEADRFIHLMPENGIEWTAAVALVVGPQGVAGQDGANGTNAPAIKLQFSANNTDFHDTFTTGDLYIRYSVDNGSIYGTGMKFIGEDGQAGTNAPTVQMQYSIDGSTLWHETAVSADYYIRFSVDGGSTWGDGLKFKGTDGAGAVDSVNGETGAVVLTTADIADSADKRYCTDAQKTVIGNTSGANTGDETQSTIKTKLGAADTDSDGYLNSTDWNTFNGKQAALGFTPVANSGNETVAGIKTFSSSPIVPTPTTDMQAATKKYVDDNAGSGSTSDTSYNGSNFTSATASPSQRAIQELAKNVGVDTLASTLVAGDNGKLITAYCAGMSFGDANLDNISASLVAAYKFSQNALTADSANSYTLTNNGTVASYATGKSGYCANFSGSNYFTMAWPSQTHPSLFCSGWINIPTNNAAHVIVSVLATSNDYVAQISISAAGKLTLSMSNTAGTDYSVSSSTTVTTGTWHHVAAYFDGTYNRVYLDGALDGTSSAFTGSLRTATQWGIGRRQSPGDQYFSGYMDELTYWRGETALFTDAAAALSAVESLYNSGSGKFYGDSSVKKYTPSTIKDTDILTNPMTASGDIIYGGTSGAVTRLAKGTDGQVLKLVSGLPAWAAESGGSAGITVLEKTDNYTTSSDFGKVIIFTSSTAAAKTLTLETMASKNGSAPIYVKNESSYNITIDGNSTETIDGQLTLILEPGQSVKIVSDNTNARTF